MLSMRSASLMRMTRMSRAIASSILRKFSACRSSRFCQGILPSLVTPSTRNAISEPNKRSSSAVVAEVSSTQSCRSPAQMEGTSSLQLADEPGDPERMHHVRVTRSPHLPVVGLGGKLITAPDEVDVRRGVIPLHAFDDVGDLEHSGEVDSLRPTVNSVRSRRNHRYVSWPQPLTVGCQLSTVDFFSASRTSDSATWPTRSMVHCAAR